MTINAATALPYVLDRAVTINATPAVVFGFLSDSVRWAAWWGEGSTVDPRPGGRVFIRHPGGIEAEGEVLEISRPERFVFTLGYTSGKPMPIGSSRVTIRLAPQAGGTRVIVTHELAEEAVRDQHVQGWRYQLSLFANAVANEVSAGAGTAVDAWFRAWSTPDAAELERQLASVAGADVRFRDRFSAVEGLSELVPHVLAAQRFMPGLRLERSGDLRHCQGTLLVDWSAIGPDGQPRGAGTNVFVLDADGRFASVTGFWR